MQGSPPLYGLDIETDTRAGGLDPATAAVVAVAIVGDGVDLVLHGDEVDVLTALDATLRALAPGVLVTWNGAAFDLPFLDVRARHHAVALGLALLDDPRLVEPPHPADPEQRIRVAFRARWHGHDHLDAYRLYRNDVARALRISLSLKSIARFVGIPAVQVDTPTLHELGTDTLVAYVRSDAAATVELARRRWPTARPFTDAAALTGFDTANA